MDCKNPSKTRQFDLLPKFLMGFILTFFLSVAEAQDLRLFSIASPTTGCTLSDQESVSIIIINVGPQLLNADFNASFVVNNGTPVTENILLPPVFNNGALISYTFNATADLSIAGNYSFDVFIDLTTDTDRSNDTLSDYEVTSYPLSVGGTLSGGTVVCSGLNGGQLILSGNTGDIINWESSTDGINWNAIANTTSTYSYSNLSNTTYYRAIIQSGTCASELSSIDTIKVDPLSVGGSIAGSDTVCSGSSGTLVLSGHTGAVINWESSTDGGSNWTTISNTTASHNYSSILIPTIFRARVKSGVCSETLSQPSIIGITPATVAGTTSGSATVCSGNNSGTITLSGYTGTILRWEKSIDSGSNWSTISNTSPSITYTNITSTTHYRAVVESCPPSQNSTTTIVTVNPPPVAGILSGATSVCSGINSGSIILSGSSGNISWESSTDGVNWNVTPGSTATLNYSSLTTSTYFRAKVSSSPCVDVYSNSILVSVDPQTEGGTINGSTTVCITSNSGTLDLIGYTGTITDWEISNDGGTTWISSGNTTSALNYSNLTNTTHYRVLVQSGICSSEYSSQAIVNVTSSADAGFITGTDSICNGSAATLNLNSYTGIISEWQISLNDSLDWQSVNETSNILETSALTTKTYFRALTVAGSCPADTSAAFAVNIVTITGDAGNDTTINKGTEATLHATGGIQYHWEPVGLFNDADAKDPIVSPEITTTFTLSITGQLGCIDTSTVIVKVIEEVKELFIPNFISPNADGINDKWEVISIENYKSEAIIFNSSGQVIFQASPYLNDWDGKVNGVVGPDGTYFYKLVLINNLGNSKVYQGNINLKSR